MGLKTPSGQLSGYQLSFEQNRIKVSKRNSQLKGQKLALRSEKSHEIK
jgi:hypothetical protein